MIDEDLKPWLIEINGGPSMTANTDFDCKLKCGLIDDVLTIIDIEGILEGNEMTVGGFDLIIDKGIKIVQEKHYQYTSTLGARNQRLEVLRHLVRKFLKRKKTEE
jgi:tubulin polyglutamylase TTLL9